MKTSTFTLRSLPGFALAAAITAVLAGCGGGGSDSSGVGNGDSVSADAANTYAADATVIASDATSALDISVLAAQAVVSAQATTASAGPDATNASGRARVMAAQPTAVVNLPVTCPGGGTATLTISGGSAGSQLNGVFDAGEAYLLEFADCKAVEGAAVVHGTLSMTVESATSTSLSMSMEATALSVALPNGSVSLSGNTAKQVSNSVDDSGATHLSSHFSTPSLTIATRYGVRSSTFTLSAVDITRQSVWTNGVLVSSSMSGTHTLDAALANDAFSYTVSTQGSVSYSASGAPVAGIWNLVLPRSAIGVDIGNASATITVDEGKDGTIDHTHTVTVAKLQSSAG